MGVPVTTGKLRTKLSEMEIGDYIACKYVASSGVVGVFSELGTSVATEIPVAGSATPNGSFYLVKVDKGLLVADRNVQHSISWDVLNAGKYIQGYSGVIGNLIPIMTSNTTPSGLASSDGFVSGLEPWRAFDGLQTTAWASTVPQGSLYYDFTKRVTIRDYEITGSGNTSESPKDWTLEGSNDGISWDIVETRSSILFTSGESKHFHLSNPASYSKFKLNITATGGNARVALRLLKLFEYFIITRSLTGGVAYADANGNSSTTDLGFGAFPANNEWDKYLVNFPVRKIQTGKTLDDVFHYIPKETWTQDTSMMAVNRNTYRTSRGLNSASIYRANVSTAKGEGVGFRPVFEYRE